MNIIKKVIISLILLSGLACSTFGGGSQNSSTGDFDLGEQSNLVPISAPSGGAAYKAIPFTNNIGKTVTITNVTFSNNACNDLSFFNITRVGSVVGIPETNLQVFVNPGETVNVQIRYLPSNCTITDYETTMYVYYMDNNKFYRHSVIFKPVVSGVDGAIPLICTEDPRDFNYIPQNFTGIPPQGTYYLRIDRMVGFIYPEAITDNAAVVSTDDENPVSRFMSPYLKFTVTDDQGNFTFSRITGCDDFSLPGDANLLVYQPVVITSAGDLTGKFNADGSTEIKDLKATIRGENIPSAESLVANSDGVFQVKMEADITTETTTEDSNLATILIDHDMSVMNLNDSNKNGKYNLVGEKLESGSVTLVGKGELISEDFIANDGIESILFSKPAYLYLQLEVTFTKREGVN